MDTKGYIGIALLVVVAILIGIVMYFYMAGEFETKLQWIISGPWKQVFTSKKNINPIINQEIPAKPGL